jgi:acyl carrier protein
LHQDVTARVRTVVAAATELGSEERPIADEASLWDAGMDSLASVRAMIAIESEFSVEFPDELLTRQTFESISSIAAAVTSLLASA